MFIVFTLSNKKFASTRSLSRLLASRICIVVRDNTKKRDRARSFASHSRSKSLRSSQVIYFNGKVIDRLQGFEGDQNLKKIWNFERSFSPLKLQMQKMWKNQNLPRTYRRNRSTQVKMDNLQVVCLAQQRKFDFFFRFQVYAKTSRLPVCRHKVTNIKNFECDNYLKQKTCKVMHYCILKINWNLTARRNDLRRWMKNTTNVNSPQRNCLPEIKST